MDLLPCDSGTSEQMKLGEAKLILLFVFQACRIVSTALAACWISQAVLLSWL